MKPSVIETAFALVLPGGRGRTQLSWTAWRFVFRQLRTAFPILLPEHRQPHHRTTSGEASGFQRSSAKKHAPGTDLTWPACNLTLRSSPHMSGIDRQAGK